MNGAYEVGISYLGSGLQEGVAIHEMAHALETALDLYHRKDFVDALRDEIENFGGASMEYVPDEYGKRICILKSRKLISEYQGRLYDEVNFWDEDNGLNPYALADYFVEGYKEYILNPNNLKEHDGKLFRFIEEMV